VFVKNKTPSAPLTVKSAAPRGLVIPVRITRL
jgi:hypothetical protein